MSTTARGAADELGVSERTIRRWIAAGRLPAEKEGGSFRIDLDAAWEVHRHSRTGRSSDNSELRGRYLEVCERLERAERELAEERVRLERYRSVLHIPSVDAEQETTEHERWGGNPPEPHHRQDFYPVQDAEQENA